MRWISRLEFEWKLDDDVPSYCWTCTVSIGLSESFPVVKAGRLVGPVTASVCLFLDFFAWQQ